MLTHACNPSTHEAEAEGSGAQGHPLVYLFLVKSVWAETLSQKTSSARLWCDTEARMLLCCTRGPEHHKVNRQANGGVRRGWRWDAVHVHASGITLGNRGSMAVPTLPFCLIGMMAAPGRQAWEEGECFALLILLRTNNLFGKLGLFYVLCFYFSVFFFLYCEQVLKLILFCFKNIIDWKQTNYFNVCVGEAFLTGPVGYKSLTNRPTSTAFISFTP